MPAIAEKFGIDVIPGFRVLALINRSSRTTVYRAVREADGRAVILKVLDPANCGPSELARLRQEYEIVRGVTAPGIVALCEADPNEQAPMLVFEDCGGESLKALAQAHRFTIAECLAFGIKIADALAQIHAAGIIHKDITPANIVYNPRTGDLKIIDFGLATAWMREQPVLDSAEMLKGTLAYISPEQTGRMNRSIDYRTDFYSLGASLYQLLTGALPFNETDPLALVHAHIAKEAPPPSALDADIPAPLSAIIMKLLAKTAEARYQSAAGIKRDLEECAQQLAQSGTIVDFPLGRYDASGSLRISQRLYGRETELSVLIAAFERTAAGRREVAMVTGYSGIGKTSLVRELYKPITAGGGYFISGKFDQLQRNVPYRAIINAFQGLVRQLLGESEAKLAAWKVQLLAALGVNGQIVIDIVPEVEIIIGPQPALIPLAPQQEQNRFNSVFDNFIRVFCRAEHPLTIYLDDLQWIDPASLKLMKHLLGDASLGHLLFIGAYRDNEVTALHPLATALDELKQAGVNVHVLTLRPLAPDHVRQMVADSLCMAPADVASLAELIATKTGGNPFFAEEFIKSLYADKLLTFERAEGVWRWDVRRIDAQASTDNVAELMIAKLKRLDVETQKVLQLAACIGNRFEVATAAIIYQKSIAQTLAVLREAIAQGLVLPITSSGRTPSEMRFAHDRVQDAAYSLIPEPQQRAARLEIGRLLLRNLPVQERQERLFEIVNHLNLGVPAITEPAEKDELVQLNLVVGRKASRSNAHDAALNYFETALALVGEAGWASDYDLMLTLHNEAAQVAFLGRHLEDADRFVEAVLKNARTLLDKIEAYGVKIESLLALSKLHDAAALGFTVFRLLGTRFPKKPGRLRLVFEYWRLRLLLLRKSSDALVNAPLMQDPYRLAEMRLLPPFLTAVYFAMPNLSSLVVFRAVRISAEYGNTPYSAFAYASYGAVLCVVGKKMAEGRRFGEIALALVERLNAVGMKAKILNLAHAHINHWSAPLRASLAPLQEAFRIGIETGDLEYAALCAITHTHSLSIAGMPLALVETTARQYRQVVAKGVACDSIAVHHQHVINLLSHTNDPCRLKGEAFDEDEMLPRLLKARQAASLLSYYATKTTLALLFERYDEASRFSREAKKLLASAASTAAVPSQLFLYSVVALALYGGQDKRERQRTLKRVERNLKNLRVWAKAAPMNNLHRVYLIEAERFRVLDKNMQAAEYYDRAIAMARKEQYTFVEALGNELAGKFYLGQDRAALAQGYLREARDIYARWGAVAKVSQMEQKYLFLTQGQASFGRLDDVTATVVTESFSVDLKALMRALKELGSEQIHSHLLEKTITLAMEVAGAQSALLYLRNNREELFLEAEASVGQDKPKILQSVPLADCNNVSATVVNYVTRTKQTVVIHDAQLPQVAIPGLNEQAYIKERGVRSILCIPLLTGGSHAPKLSGLLYLENNAVSHTFTERAREPLEVICLLASGRLELSRKAVTDGLTNLYNHDYLQGILEKETSLANRTQRPLSLIMIDIDHFKKFNDDHGHQAGDAVLMRVAALIRSGTRLSDVAARYGGEEMAIVLPDTDGRLAYDVAERVRVSIESEVILFEQKALSVTVSMGVATYGADISTAKALVKAADQALYRSKHDGRNRVTAAAVIPPS